MPIEVVTDAVVIQDYYLKTWHRRTRYFAYGTSIYERGYLADRLRAMGLEPEGYLL